MTAGVYGGVAIALVLAVVAVAYGTQAPSFGVAEFAPAARSQVSAPTTSVPDGSARGGRGGRGNRATTTTTAPASAGASTPAGGAPSAPTTRVARSRSCVGNPPRQIEDPQAPACMAAIFEGDNGGATHPGVTSTEITVAIPGGSGYQVEIAALFEFFNRSFEFYGRRLRPVFPSGSVANPTAARAMAADIAALPAFGVLTGMSWSEAPHEALFQGLARSGIVSVTRGVADWLSDRATYDSLHPYVWSVQPSLEDYSRNLGSLVCSALAGRPAQHAADPNLRTATRRFGILASGSADVPWTRPLVDALDTCGVTPAVADQATSNGGDRSRTLLERLRSDGVTTMICLCEGYQSATAYSTALSLGYQPEWLLPRHSTPDDEVEWQWIVRNGGSLPYGLMEYSRIVPVQAEGWFQAFQAIDPSLMTKTSDNGYFRSLVGRAIYSQLLVLASGIQAAGPALNPETFAQGLMSAQFPNTGAGAAPYWQAGVGFGPGDHSFIDDYALAWWSPTAEPLRPGSQGQYGVGSWCYLGAGQRFTPGTYPADADNRFFNPSEPCR